MLSILKYNNYVLAIGLLRKKERKKERKLPWDPFATFNVAVLIHSFVHIGCAFGTTILFLYSLFAG
jgi:hypothetical protein